MSIDFSPEAFGKYYLVDKIAVGGMAEIFKAKSFSHAGFEKLLVIKRILQHHSENEDFVKMFIDEAKISVQLQHPNIVHIYDFGKLHSNCYIAMECVDGKDVKQILRKLAERRKYLPEEYAVLIAHDALAGLEYAHNKTTLHGDPLNIVHRDMSPSNVLVGYEGDVKVADFGIAKAEHRTYDTKDGVLKGKFEYMSPEQARGKSIHSATDVFSTGIILWEMLTGRRMFKTDSDIATLEKIKAGGYPPPSVLNPHISARLDNIVMKALATDAADRYPNALAFQNTLANYLAPNTPGAVKRSMSEFLSELFTEERSQERHALDAGSQIAKELFKRPEDLTLEPEWQEEINTAGPTLHQASQPPKRSSLITPLLVVLIVLASVAIYLQTLGSNSSPASISQSQNPTAQPNTPLPQSSVAEVRIDVSPANAEIFVDGESIGQGPTQTLEARELGNALIRIEAEGYEPKEVSKDLQAGPNNYSFDLTRVAAPPPAPEVIVIETPKEKPPAVTPPKEVVVRYGQISVNVRGGWGHIEINGKKVTDTPYKGQIRAGRHTIRVYNPAADFDIRKTIEVKAGELKTISIDPQSN